MRKTRCVLPDLWKINSEKQILSSSCSLIKVLSDGIRVASLSVCGGVRDHFAIVDELLGAIKGEARDYLEKKTEELKKQGANKVSYVLEQGIVPDQIISLGRKTPDNLIAMCTHGWSGVKRWALGSVTETVVRHSGDPVLIVRAS